LKRTVADRAVVGRRALVVIVLVAGAAARAAAADPGSGDEQCNAFFPLRDGARWVYEEGEVSAKARMRRTITAQSVTTSGDATTADLLQDVSLPGQPDVIAGHATTHVVCNASGVQLTIDGSAGVGGEASGVVKAKMPGLPPAAELKPGYSWRGDSQVETMDAGTKVIADGASGSRVERIESVTVPAGTFPDALRIESVQTLTLHRGSDQRYARQETVEWYVRNVGLVKRETRVSHDANAAVGVEELQTYSGLPK
jgi:hypothetical protein